MGREVLRDDLGASFCRLKKKKNLTTSKGEILLILILSSLGGDEKGDLLCA